MSLFTLRLVFSVRLSYPLFFPPVLLLSSLLSFCHFSPSSFFWPRPTSHISGTTVRKWAPWVGLCSPWNSGSTLPGFSAWLCLLRFFRFFLPKNLLDLFINYKYFFGVWVLFIYFHVLENSIPSVVKPFVVEPSFVDPIVVALPSVVALSFLVVLYSVVALPSVIALSFVVVLLPF